MKTDIKYKKPTIIEAVFELRFKPLPNWEIGSFVKFSELAKENGFPILKDSPKQFQVSFGSEKPVITSATSHIQTWSMDESQLWQAGQTLYAANQREPYQGWEIFRPHIVKGLDIYKEVANPQAAEALIMRFINRIIIDDQEAPSSLIAFLPHNLEYSNNLVNYGCKAEYKFEEEEIISITATKDITQTNINAIILEILYLKPNPSLESEELNNTIEKIHDRIGEYFEKSITDKLRVKMEVL